MDDVSKKMGRTGTRPTHIVAYGDGVSPLETRSALDDVDAVCRGVDLDIRCHHAPGSERHLGAICERVRMKRDLLGRLGRADSPSTQRLKLA